MKVTLAVGDMAPSQAASASSDALTLASPTLPETRYANVLPFRSVMPPSVDRAQRSAHLDDASRQGCAVGVAQSNVKVDLRRAIGGRKPAARRQRQNGRIAQREGARRQGIGQHGTEEHTVRHFVTLACAARRLCPISAHSHRPTSCWWPVWPW